MQRISIAEYAELFAAVDPVAEAERILKMLKQERTGSSVNKIYGGGYKRPQFSKGSGDFGRPSDARAEGAETTADSDFRTTVLFPKLREAYAEKTGMRLL